DRARRHRGPRPVGRGRGPQRVRHGLGRPRHGRVRGRGGEAPRPGVRAAPAGMKRGLAVLAVALAATCLAPAAAAHPATSFTACAVRPNGTRCGQDVVYYLGDTIRLRGHVTPPYASLRAQVWREKP